MLSATTTHALLLALLAAQATHQESTDALIKKLGSPRFKEREAATQKLLARWPDAITALNRAMRSSDEETAKRAAVILEKFEWRTLKHSLKRLERFVKEGKVDLAVELLAHWPKGKYDEECWQIARDLSRKISQCHKSKYKRHSIGPNLGESPKAAPVVIGAKRISKMTKGVRGRTTFLFARAEVVDFPFSGPFLNGCLFFTSGNVRMHQSMWTAIFSNGNVQIDNPESMIIIADGDVFIGEGGAVNCIIIARGKVTCRDLLLDSLIVSGKSVIRNRKLHTTSKIVENESKPLGFIQFFEPAREGIIVEKANGGVQVTELAADKPFRKAGLQKGDIITDVVSDDKQQPVDSPEVFRRLLRRSYAWQQEMTFRVLRRGKCIPIRIPRPDGK